MKRQSPPLAGIHHPLKAGSSRTPKRSLQELAEEFGVSWQKLKGMLTADANSPQAQFRTGSGKTPRNTWYDPAAVRAWWKAKQ